METSLDRDYAQMIRTQMLDTYDVSIDDISWEEFRTLWGRLSEVEDSIKWGQALICAAVETKYGDGSIGAFAQDMGIGESTAYRLRRTWIAFPEPGDRFPDLTFGHHALAAMTNDPYYWIENAAIHGMSTYAMEKKIRATMQKTKAALVDNVQRAIGGEGIDGAVDDIGLPSNHNVPLSPTEPPTYPAREREIDERELERMCAKFICDCLDSGFLLSMVGNVLKRVIDTLEGNNVD